MTTDELTQVANPGPAEDHTLLATVQGVAAAAPDPNADLKLLRRETERALIEIGGRRIELSDELAFAKGNAGLDSESARELVATIARGALGVWVHAKLDPWAVASLLDRKATGATDAPTPQEEPAKWR